MSTFTISFDVSHEDAVKIAAIVNRAFEEGLVAEGDRLNLDMSITACHANGNPLDLDGLLAARVFDFTHDVIGIDRHISRDTGLLTDLFSPRYSRRD